MVKFAHILALAALVLASAPAGALTRTSTPTKTRTPTRTQTYTGTPTFTHTYTRTPTLTPTVTQTATITNTPASTPFSQGTPVPVINHVRWTSKTSGTLVSDVPVGTLACIVGATLTPATTTDTVSLLDGNGNTVWTAAVSPLATGDLSRYGPCLDLPITMTGTGTITLGWMGFGSGQ